MLITDLAAHSIELTNHHNNVLFMFLIFET